MESSMGPRRGMNARQLSEEIIHEVEDAINDVHLNQERGEQHESREHDREREKEEKGEAEEARLRKRQAEWRKQQQKQKLAQEAVDASLPEGIPTEAKKIVAVLKKAGLNVGLDEDSTIIDFSQDDDMSNVPIVIFEVTPIIANLGDDPEFRADGFESSAEMQAEYAEQVTDDAARTFAQTMNKFRYEEGSSGGGNFDYGKTYRAPQGFLRVIFTFIGNPQHI